RRRRTDLPRAAGQHSNSRIHPGGWAQRGRPMKIRSAPIDELQQLLQAVLSTDGTPAARSMLRIGSVVYRVHARMLRVVLSWPWSTACNSSADEMRDVWRQLP